MTGNIIYREGFSWPDHARIALDDDAVDLRNNCDSPFPGYIAKPGHPFLPQQPLTHPAHDQHVQIGNYSYGDSPDEHKKNLKVQGPDWHYATKKVEYHCNRDGYRTAEWDQIDWANSIVLLGCSMVFGIGVSQDETIAHFLEQYSGRPVVNLGFPSGPNQLILNNASALRNNFDTPYGVVILWSTLDRFMFYDQYVTTVGLWTDSDAESGGVKLQKLYKLRNFNEINSIVDSYYMAQTARAIWADRTRYLTGSYYAKSAHYTRSDLYFTQDCKGRDLVHPGPGTHRRTAQLIHERLLSK